MARRGWDSLSDSYRNRLIRGGVDRAAYESGAGLQKARGHKSAAHERQQSRTYRDVDKWIQRFAKTYGKDPDDVREAVTEHGMTEAERVMKYQQDMERLYDKGETAKATARYKMPRTKAYPDWLFYYHGAYS